MNIDESDWESMIAIVVEEISQSFGNDYTYGYDPYRNIKSENSDKLNAKLDGLKTKTILKISGEDIKMVDGKLINVTASSLSEETQKNREISLPTPNRFYYQNLINDLSFFALSYPSLYLSNIEFLGAYKSGNKNSFTIGKYGSSFEYQLYEFLNFPIIKNAQIFLDKWIMEFGLEKLQISFSSGNIASITFNNRPLSDLGFGINQLLSILLKIVTIASKTNHYVDTNWDEKLLPLFRDKNDYLYDSTLIIEEPETNLHPKFQAMLADLFVDANKQFNIQFIIETHSEYLIRKLQYLTGKGELKPVDTSVYYFHHLDNIPQGEEQVKKIVIQEDGSLDGDFGTGFFDEALNWKLELMKLKNHQKN